MRILHAQLAGFACALLAVDGAHAGVKVDIDRETLDRLVSAVAVTEVRVPLATDRSLRVELRDLRIMAIEPPTASGVPGGVRAAVRAVAPEIGLDLPLEPRIVLGVVREGGSSLLELRFDDLPLALPLLGRVNLARLVPPRRFEADGVFRLSGSAGDVEVTSRLLGVAFLRDAVRLEFAVDVPAARAGAAAAAAAR